MSAEMGRVIEIREVGGASGLEPHALAYIACSSERIPAPGQYLQALSQDASFPTRVEEPALAHTLFSTILFEPNLYEVNRPGFWAVPTEKVPFTPGVEVLLRGPLGRGFQDSGRTRRMGVAALGDQLARLLPLIERGVKSGAEVALFCNLPLPSGLPPVVEVHPLIELPDVLPWADELILDLPGASVETLRERLGVSSGRRLPCPGQALVEIPMPCGGAAACGVCAVRTNKGTSLVCEQGPVYDLTQLFR